MRVLWLLLVSAIPAHAQQFDFSQFMNDPYVRQLARDPYVQNMVRQAMPMVTGAMNSRSRSSANDVSDDVDQNAPLEGDYYIRTGPGKGYRDAGVVDDYDGKVTLTGRRRGDWLQVKYGHGRTGWVSADAAQSAPPSHANPDPTTKPPTPEASTQPDASAAPETETPHETVDRPPETSPAPEAPSIEAAQRPSEPPVHEEKVEKPIDGSKPECANSPQELAANPRLKDAAQGYDPFVSWRGDHSDIKVDRQTGKAQVIVRQQYASMAKMFGAPIVSNIKISLCMDKESAKPYVIIGGTRHNELVRRVTFTKGGHSESYEITR